ncbi:MAG TPA: bifunctional phosphopantothenoylcysteine decarboxylase/phosphopantothenate--cysteine ligase CoaBC, partial [Fimbriimonas sp.]|nr:bifunctional phosphopantothenoylcysteine decarboxylase/phosphopantothenate--cysteine ligase CoaBC [Fimbriimonas sp.]
LRRLEERGVFIVQPTEGDVACGENGQGKLASVPAIIAAVQEVVGRPHLLKGQRVLITSGPTQEPIDDVRFISNRSSGKMGAALARAALVLGAEVSVVSGPVRVAYPTKATVVQVATALDMLEAARQLAHDADLIIGAAAVADYRMANPVEGKMRRSSEHLVLELIPNPDIIAELAQAFPSAQVIGFAAEPDPSLDTAREKIIRKGLRAIAVNDIGRSDIGFEVDYNEITLLWADGRAESSGRRSKLQCALWLMTQLVTPLD